MTWPPVLPGILFRYENRSGRQHCSSQSLPLACLQSSLKFDFLGMLAVELCDGSSCRGCMFSFVQDVSQAVPVAMSQIHQQHMRTRLYLCNLGELHMYLKSNTLNNGTKGANLLKVWTMGQIGYLHNGLFDIINMD